MEIQLTYLAKIKKAINKSGEKIEVKEGCDILTMLNQYLCVNNEQLRNIMFKDNALEHNILIYLNNAQVNDLHIKLQENDDILLMTPIAGG
jgi:molybdopterin converting factor small subunit